MTIHLRQGLCLAGAAAVLYCVQNTLTSSHYGPYLPIASQGIATGIVAGVFSNKVLAFPKDAFDFFIMSISGMAAIELTKAALSSHFTNVAGLTFIAGAAYGLVQSSKFLGTGNLGI